MMRRDRTVQGSRQELASDLAKEIQTLCLEKLSIRVRSTSQDLFDSGLLDSLSLVQIILELERHFQIQLPLEELDILSLNSIEAMASLVERRKAAAQTLSHKVLDQLAS